MRAKNEYKFIAEAYDTKLILERIVDGKLMCPEACCGSPVMECKCGPDCPHCNCHEIQKLAAKEEDNEVEFPNSEYGRSLERDAKQHEQEDKEMRDDIERLQKLVADGYVRLHKDGEFQVLAPWMGDTNFPILKAQGWKEVPFPSIRLTLDSPGTASVQLRPPYTDIQTYLDLGYKVVEDYTKATQSEDNEENEDENLEVTRGDTSPKGFMDEVEHTEDAEGKTLTLNEEEINVVQEALLRLEPESFWREGGSKDEFYNKEEVDRMLYIAQDILKKSGVE